MVRTIARGAGIALVALISISPLAASGAGESDANVVHVYSHRHYETDQRLYDRFEELTGIEVRVVEAGADELIQRLEAEGSSTDADLLLTVDAGRLVQAEERGLLQPANSPVAESLLPANLRDEDGMWYALTRRARIIAYHVDRVDPSELSTYEALANPEWEGRIAVRTSSNIYNVSLMAAIIEELGEEAARAWAAGIDANLARQPQGGDTDQLRAVAAGIADVAISNTYYVGLLLASSDPADVAVAEQIGIFFPNQPGVAGSDGRGTHINISGVGITRHADNADGARQLLEFLLSDEAQSAFAQANSEYPVRAGIPPSPAVASWGDFVADDLPLSTLGANARRATMIFDEVGWP